MAKISIIIPVYNQEKYIKRCIDSIIKQSYKNFEAILVDDKSTDKTVNIIENYVRKDRRVKLIKLSKNRGPFVARNTALSNATGEYFTMIDPDDYVGSDYLENLIEGEKKSGADIVRLKKFIMSYPDKAKNVVATHGDIGKTVGNFKDYIAALGDGVHGWGVWDTLFKIDLYKKAKEYLDSIEHNIIKANDLVLFNALFYYAKTYHEVDKYSYYYWQSGESTETTTSVSALERNVKSIKLVMSLLEKFFISTGKYHKKQKNDFKMFSKNEIGYHEYRLSMAKMKVSIIVPVYNTEKYLQECIDSILNQTYKNIEIILIDDNSSDGSDKIIDEYAARNKNIKVVHKKKNAGPAAARNTGMDIATGDYITFVDSDDILHELSIEILAKRVLKTNAEVVYYEYETFINTPSFDISGIDSDLNKYSKLVFSLEEIKNNNRFMLFLASACTMLINKKFLLSKKIKFDESLKRSEDYPFFYKVILSATKISYINKKLYYYRQDRKESKTANSKDIEYFVIALDQIRIFLIKKKIWQEYENDFRKLVAHYIFHFIMHYKVNDKYIVYAKRLLLRIRLSEYVINSNEYSDTEKRLLTIIEKDDKKSIIYNIEITRPMNYDQVNTTDKKRILCPTAFGTMSGGGERSSYALWRWLSKYFDIIIALPKNTDIEYLEMCKKDRISYIICDYYNTEEKREEWVEFSKIIIDQKIDIVLPAMYLEPAFSAAAATNTPAVFLDYGLLQQLIKEFRDDKSFNEDIMKRLSMSNLIITNAMSGIDAAKKIDSDFRVILAHSYVKPQQIGYPKKSRDPRLIFPARIDPNKNQHMLLEVARELKTRNISNKIVLIGDYEEKYKEHKEYYDNIKKFIKNNNLDENVEMTGWLQNPWSIFRKSDIYITTTKSEAVGRATTEAITAGVPILIPDIPGHREYKELLKISNKHFFQPGNVEELVDKALYLINHIDEAIAEAKIYKQRALCLFSEEMCNKSVVPALRSIIGQDNPGRMQFIDYVENLVKNTELSNRHINNLEKELASHLSTKRAIKLVLGNIKRRIISVFRKQ